MRLRTATTLLRPTLALALSLAASACSMRAQSGAPAPAAHADAKRVVETFIARYLGQFTETAERPADWDPMTVVKQHLSPALQRALAEDRAASAANQEEIVGLDFDPFTNSQDPCERYSTGRTAQRADTVMVELLGTCHGQNPLIPDVVYYLVRQQGQFVIADLEFPHGGTLHGTLRELAEMRRRPPPR